MADADDVGDPLGDAGGAGHVIFDGHNRRSVMDVAGDDGGAIEQFELAADRRAAQR